MKKENSNFCTGFQDVLWQKEDHTTNQIHDLGWVCYTINTIDSFIVYKFIVLIIGNYHNIVKAFAIKIGIFKGGNGNLFSVYIFLILIICLFVWIV